jgi:hypothetical protein
MVNESTRSEASLPRHGVNKRRWLRPATGTSDYRAEADGQQTSTGLSMIDVCSKRTENDSAIKAALADAQTEISKIVKPAAIPGQASGLQDAFANMASALRVVEGGDRAVPSQAIAVYNESAQRVKAAIAEWSEFKTTKLSRLNQKLSEAV